MLYESRNSSNQVDLLVRALEKEMPTNVQALYSGISRRKDAVKDEIGITSPTETVDDVEELNDALEDGDDCPNDADDEHSDPSYAPHQRARL